MYPRIKVTLLNVCAAHFGPPLIEWLSRELKVPKVGRGWGVGVGFEDQIGLDERLVNMTCPNPNRTLQNAMFLTAPDSTFKYKLDSLGGARIITH